MEEFFGVEVSGFLAQEGFKTPLEIGTVPGPEAVTPGGNPVVAERLPHGYILYGGAVMPREKLVEHSTEMLGRRTGVGKIIEIQEQLGKAGAEAEERRREPPKELERLRELGGVALSAEAGLNMRSGSQAEQAAEKLDRDLLQGRFAPWAEAQGLPSPLKAKRLMSELKLRPPAEGAKSGNKAPHSKPAKTQRLCGHGAQQCCAPTTP